MDAPAARRAFVVATALGLAGLGILAWWQQRAVFDDAWISFRYARNWAMGLGPVFNPGERVEGYTNFLWMALAAAALRLDIDPLAAMRSLGVAAHAAMLALLGAGFGRVAWKRGASGAWLLPFLGALILPAGFSAMPGSGLETAFSASLLVVLGALQMRARASGAARAGADVVAVAACLTRLDATIALIAASLAAGGEALRAGDGAGRALRVSARTFSIPAVCVALVWAAKASYYGAWLPNSYWAKGADGFHWSAGFAYLAAFASSNWQLAALLPLAVATLALPLAPGVRRAALYAALTLAAHALYVAKVGGDFMEYRLLWQVYPLLVGLAAPALFALARRQLFAAAALAFATALLSTSPVVLETRYGMQSVAQMDAAARDGLEVGAKLREVLPPGTRIATTLAGTLPYASGLETVDQWGLNDREIARGEPLGQFQRGHLRLAPAAVLAERRVALAFGHPDICPCTAPCFDASPAVFVRLEGDRCVGSAPVVLDRPLAKWLCAHPEHFLLKGVRCPPGPRP